MRNNAGMGSWRRRVAVVTVMVAYALVAALCRPLTWGSLIAVLAAGLPLSALGIRNRPRRPQPAGARSAAFWLSIGVLAGAYELGLWLGPDDAAYPTLSTLADPVLATYPGRVAGYLLWIGAGVWLVRR